MIEKLIELIAPHQCVSCGIEDNIICDDCLGHNFAGFADVCVLCCRQKSNDKICCGNLTTIFIAAEYGGVAKEVIGKFKFGRAKTARKVLARVLDGVVSYLPSGTIVVPVPTIPKHIRIRGYDHAQLIANEFAKLRGLKSTSLLYRQHSYSQVGSNRILRIEQATQSLALKHGQNLEGKNIILIDDVCTTGSTLAVCAELLKNAGAKQVNAAVVAWQLPKS